MVFQSQYCFCTTNLVLSSDHSWQRHLEDLKKGHAELHVKTTNLQRQIQRSVYVESLAFKSLAFTFLRFLYYDYLRYLNILLLAFGFVLALSVQK